MASAIAQLKKLRGKSLREIGVRGRQELAKFNERVLGSGASEISDTALLREINPDSRNGNGEGSAMLILERIRSSTASASPSTAALPFFPSLACRSDVSTIIEQRFPGERHALLERAERAIRGRFDLLGFGDLSFGHPIDWRLEPVSGKRSPLDHWSRVDYLNPQVAGDKKITWELNRHTHFVTLGQAYWLTGDERYARSFVSQASSWMDANPPKQGINWASSLELAFRSISWLYALHLFAGSDQLSSKFVARIIKTLVAHGRHIESYLSYYFSPNTHLTGEALGLFYLGAALPELNRASNWQATGLRILIEQLPKHIQPDGVYFEQSSYYHRYTADFYIHLTTIARKMNLDLPGEVEDRLTLALDHLMWVTRPDGSSSLVGDDDGGRLISLAARESNDFRDTLAAGAALFGRGDWKFVAGRAPFEMLWLFGPDGLSRYDEIEEETPIQNVRGFSSGGYFIMRDGWSNESSYVLFNGGPHGSPNCGHAHSDALSIEYATAGATWLVDPGTVTYTGDAKSRDYFRSTEAHNTVTVDGLSQSVSAGAFSWKHIAQSAAYELIEEDSFAYIEGLHDGYRRLADPVMHSRSVLFVKASNECHSIADLPSYLIISDRFTASESHSYAARFHFSPDVTAEAKTSSVRATHASGNRLNIAAFSQAASQARVEEGFVSRVYGQREAARVAVVEFEGKGPQELVTFLIPSTVQSEASVEPMNSNEDSCSAFIIHSNHLMDVIATGDCKKTIECEGLAVRGSLGWARFANDEFARGCMIRGMRLEIAGVFAIDSPAIVRCCAVEIKDGQIEITIHNANTFYLSFSTPRQSIIVNKARFSLRPNTRNAAFIREGSGWRLSKED